MYSYNSTYYCCDTMDKSLKIKYKKNKIYIIDNIVSYPLTFSETSINCCCADYTKNIKSTSYLCKHVLFFLDYKGLDLNLLQHWLLIKKEVGRRVRVVIKRENKNLWDIIDEQIFNNDCGFCLEKIKNKSKKSYKNIKNYIADGKNPEAMREAYQKSMPNYENNITQ